jgi:hypothetical protein
VSSERDVKASYNSGYSWTILREKEKGGESSTTMYYKVVPVPRYGTINIRRSISFSATVVAVVGVGGENEMSDVAAVDIFVL